MKVAIPYEAGQVFQHFGHSAAFMVYEIEAGKVVSSTLLPTNGSGHGALAGLLAANKVNALICGGTGSADAAAAELAGGRLTFDPDAVCAHHEGHGEGHDCGSHGHDCGSADVARHEE